MREIKFRGERFDSGEWEYGHFVKYGWTGKEKCYIMPEYASALYAFEVIPETVGQFTGLKDKHGKEIYEGDIFESRASENKADWKRWVCIYQDGSFCFETEIGKRKKKIEQNMLCDDEIKLYGLVVIGNIYENPELLEANNG